MNYIN